MKTYIALLRGINVGGNNIIKMAELRDVLEAAGLSTVQTYIQSGNIVFESESPQCSALRATISKTINDRYAFKPQVLVLDIDQLEAAIDAIPFSDASFEDNKLHLYFLATQPPAERVDAAKELAGETEQCELIDEVFYLLAPDGVARSSLAKRVESVLQVNATARNLRTCRKLRDMANRSSR